MFDSQELTYIHLRMSDSQTLPPEYTYIHPEVKKWTDETALNDLRQVMGVICTRKAIFNIFAYCFFGHFVFFFKKKKKLKENPLVNIYFFLSKNMIFDVSLRTHY